MVEFFSFALIAGISLVLAAIFVLYPKREDDVFVKLSIIFIFMFYLIPSYMVMFSGGFWYGLKFAHFGQTGFLVAAISIWVFILGYFARDIKLLLQRREVLPSQFIESPSISKNRVVGVLAAGILLFVLQRILSPDSVELYDIRQGSGESNHFTFLLSLVSSSLMLSAFFVCIKAKWWPFAGICISLILLGHLLGSPGRVTLAITVTVFLIFIFRFSPRFLVSVVPLIILVLFPILINGKEVIYRMVVLGELPRLSDLYNLNALQAEDIFNNLAHPFVSIMFSGDLIELVGFRYFYDYAQGFLFYLRVVGLDFGDSLTYFNTESILGVPESVIPPGYIAFGYVQAWYLGVFVAGLFYRFTFSLVSMTSLYRVCFGRELWFYAAFTAANTFYVGDMRQLVVLFFMKLFIMHVVGDFVAKRPITHSVVG